MANVLVLVPVKPTLAPVLRDRAEALMNALEAGEHALECHIRTCPEVGSGLPFSAHAAARNAMLDAYLTPAHTHVLWIDADLVEYPADLITRLYDTHSAAIIAPFVFIEGGRRFYDVQGFIDTEGRRAQPWGDHIEGGDLIPMQSVGTCYLAPASLYRTARYEARTGHTEHYSICQAAWAQDLTVWATRRVDVFHADLPRYGEAYHTMEAA